VAGSELGNLLNEREHVVYADAYVSAIVDRFQWPNNRGHVVIFPNEHYENIYDLPLHLATRIHDLARGIALAMKLAYGCDGISTRQHNEPGGGQEVWHYHLHIVPRYVGDNHNGSKEVQAPADERAAQAAQLRAALIRRSRKEGFPRVPPCRLQALPCEQFWYQLSTRLLPSALDSAGADPAHLRNRGNIPRFGNGAG
jgi:histidine triad (HIT) family protein